MLRTSREIPGKILNHIVESQDEYERANNEYNKTDQNRTRNGAFNETPKETVFVQPLFPEERILLTESRRNDSQLLLEIRSLIQTKSFETIADKLTAAEKNGKFVETEVVNEMVEKCIGDLPSLALSDIPSTEECRIEPPRHIGINQIDAGTKYRLVYASIPHLHRVCGLYEHSSYLNKRFQENYIWLCYHMDDTNALQELLYAYLKHDNYNSTVLSYLMSSFILNYEVEFCKNLFQNILGMNRPLASELLETTIIQLIRVKAVFENVTEIFSMWTRPEAAIHCEEPSRKTMVLVFREYLNRGSTEEIKQMSRILYDRHIWEDPLISATMAQGEIVKRNFFDDKKPVVETDILRIHQIISSINDSDTNALTSVLYSYLSFFAKHSNLKMMQLILMLMNEHKIPINDHFYTTICRHYQRSEKFLPLLGFLTRTSQHSLPYSPVFVKMLYDTYVGTYPYYAAQFHRRFHSWVEQNKGLSLEDKELLLQNCKIHKIESNITPYGVTNASLTDTKKYDATSWCKIVWKKDPWTGKATKNREQIAFRVEKGLRDVLRKGVEPDSLVLHTTFRRLHFQSRIHLLEMMKSLRLSRSYIRCQIHGLQIHNDKDKLKEFVAVNEKRLSSRNKILLARILMNKKMYKETTGLMESVNPHEMTDKMELTRLNIRLRNEISKENYSRMVQIMDGFSIDETILSPYICNHCKYIERKLVQKEQKMDGNTSISLQTALDRIRGLIGDIEVRLSQDKADLGTKVKEMFVMMDGWIDRSNDERKL